jgi:hypothetical protein
VAPGLLFVLGMVMFLDQPLVLLLYAASTLALLVVYYYTGLFHARYCGHLLIVLVVCCWLAEYYPKAGNQRRRFRRLLAAGKQVQPLLLGSVLLANIIGASVAYAKESQSTFSASKAAAMYIKESKLESVELAGMTDFVLSPLASYFNKQIFYFQRMEFGSFTRWDQGRTNDVTFNQIAGAISYLLSQGRTNLLVLMNDPLQAAFDGKHFTPVERCLLANDIKLDLLRFIRAGIVPEEEYHIYLIQKTDPAKVDPRQYPLLSP